MGGGCLVFAVSSSSCVIQCFQIMTIAAASTSQYCRRIFRRFSLIFGSARISGDHRSWSLHLMTSFANENLHSNLQIFIDTVVNLPSRLNKRFIGF